MVQMKSALGGIPVSRAMLTDFSVLSPSDTLGRAVELILAGSQQDFPVVDGGRTVGIVVRSDLLIALTRRGQGALVREVMQQDFRIVDSFAMLESAFTQMRTCGCHTLPVTHNGQLVGLLTMDNVGEFLAIQASLRPAQPNAEKVVRTGSSL